ncbi:beta-N-acetylhexosaminidase [Parabacteroides merdae]|jgi:hexosaminidase|uniref:beta-N-acetylhexosaminidase n=1 Tax=Parabacteroides merdae TaxID=46503 RepID=A0AB37LWY8_9BACT|nr:family 20 glycosylhydrolase [Parabacteroides merdae]RGN53874.1 beta-N-acetylhexosaminidase [Parabacteroides merdae]
MLLPKQSRNYVTGLAAACSLLLIACSSEEVRQVNLIPKPEQMTMTGGTFTVDSLALFGGQSSRNIKTVIDEAWSGNPEGYQLDVTPGGIDLRAGSPDGLFYGMQTLRQLYAGGEVPCVSIRDNPRFGYRGLHLDVSRHFFSKEEVMKLLDVMSFYKLNTLHMHLTDAGGWRIEIDKYPKLTSETAFRTESDWRKWWDGRDRKYLPEGTPGAYGGYYTKEDIREIVKHAASKHINIIPEIEFPGHSEEVLMAYPELSCSGKPYQNGDFCIGNEKSFTFMEDVLAEVIDLFPSEYIHVGGDEAGKSAWKKCPKCQALMTEKGMKSVDELQSYMIHRAEEFLNSKDRRLIGWDEILEGGLAPEATVMSWRGEDGGIKAARMGHDVVMTPGNYMYLDFYQADPKTQPYAIGGYTPIKKVYSYDPVPADSLTVEECRHILGVQANTWTEYIQTPEHLEYMMFPRALAVAEIGWTPQELRTWEDFKPRMNAHISKLQGMGIRTFTLSDELEVTMQVDTAGREIEVILDAEKYPAEIRYTTDGSVPVASSALYAGPITVQDSAHIKAAIFRDGVLQGTPTEKKVDYHRAINKPIHYNSKLYEGYMAGGTNALLDGYRGGLTYLDGRWQGYLDDLDCVIDMEEETDIHKVSIRFMQLIGPGVFQPGQVELLTSEDGENFISRGIVPTTVPADDPDLLFQEYTFDGNWKTRYIRLKAPRANPGFIFADEIVVW